MNQVKNTIFSYHIPEQNQLIPIENQNFQYYVLISEEEVQRPTLKALLDKIIAALPIKLDDNALLLTIQAGQFIMLSKLLEDDRPKTIICFGIEPTTLCLQAEKINNQLLHIAHLKLLMVEKLAEYNNDQSKKVLWAQLKSLFELS